MALGFDTFDEFYTHQGMLPQDYFNAVIMGMAAGEQIPDLTKRLAVAQKAVASYGDQNAINAAIGEGTDRKRQDLADAINLADSLVSLLDTWKANQASAEDFLDGKIPDARSFCGRECNELAQAGWIDTTKVPS